MTNSEEGRKVHSNMSVCEMCLQSAEEEAMAEPDECELLCVTLGSEIGDHLCEEIENDDQTRCRCACHESVKRVMRGHTLAEGGGA